MQPPLLYSPAFNIDNYLGVLCVVLYGIVLATFVSTCQSLCLLVSSCHTVNVLIVMT